MEYLINSKEEVRRLCSKYRIEKYTINSDLSIDVSGNVRFGEHDLTHIPLKFGIVRGCFSLYGCGDLISLKNAPYHVDSYFDCDFNKLTSLQYAPVYVGGYFTAIENNLTSLDYLPEIIKGSIHVGSNPFVENDELYRKIESFAFSSNYEYYTTIEEIIHQLDGIDAVKFQSWIKVQERMKTIQDIIKS